MAGYYQLLPLSIQRGEVGGIDSMKLCPIVMVRNESFYIRQILQPLVDVFGIALVGDTGSTDDTPAIAESVAGVVVTRYGEQDHRALPQVRKRLCEQGQAWGYEWALMVDGDELYHPDALRLLRDAEMPPGKRAGFVPMRSIDMDEHGQLWELDDLFSRLAIHPITDRHSGEYPFESPESFGNPAWYHYFPDLGRAGTGACPYDGPALGQYGLHLHRLQRSPSDGVVFMRVQKQFQFSLANVQIPRTKPLEEPWLSLLR